MDLLLPTITLVSITLRVANDPNIQKRTLGEMCENGDVPGGIDLALAYEYYSIAAVHDHPAAYFKVA